MKKSILLAAAVVLGCGTGIQYDPKTASFYQGKAGGMVMTPNGPVFHESADVPERVVFRDPNEPWRPPIGFILPKSGTFTQTSTPTTIASQGIVVVLRPSDTRVPSWGGEILLRVDVHATGGAQLTRDPEHLAIVVDGEDEAYGDAVDAALARLGGKDLVTIVDARGARVIVPTMPATHRSLALAATAHRLRHAKQPRDLPKALVAARAALGKAPNKRLLVLTGDVPAFASKAIAAQNPPATAVLDPKAGLEAVRAFVPPFGKVTFKDLVLSFEGVPAPSRVLESSGGEAVWTLEGTDLVLGDVRAGDARSEMLRVTVPPWVPGKGFALHVSGRAIDASTGAPRSLPATLHAVYDDDIERIADSRHGDVIAYASALATLHRLHAAFVGDTIEKNGGLIQLAKAQAQSLALLARDFPDRGFAEDAMILRALLDASLP